MKIQSQTWVFIQLRVVISTLFKIRIVFWVKNRQTNIFLYHLFVFQVVEAMKMNQYPLYSCYLVLLAVCLCFMVLYYVSLKFIKQKSSQDW